MTDDDALEGLRFIKGVLGDTAFAAAVGRAIEVMEEKRKLEATLTQVTGLLEPRSMGRPPEYRLCSTCRAMLLAALGRKEG